MCNYQSNNRVCNIRNARHSSLSAVASVAIEVSACHAGRNVSL